MEATRLAPKCDNLGHTRVLLCYKNFSNDCNVSHIGLGVTAQYTAKTLTHAGIKAQAVPIVGAEELEKILDGHGQGQPTNHPVTHVVIMAQFIPTQWLQRLTRKFPFVKFSLNCHSNVGFLQAEPNAIRLFREAIDLETGTTNFFAGGNNQRFVKIIQDIYGRPIQFLPNLYFLHGHEPIHRPHWSGGTIRIGAFGSLRIYKNFSTAVTAAMEVGHMLRSKVELWINSGRTDGAGNAVYKTALAWTKDVPNIELKEFPWASWPEFKRKIATMHIMLQPSYTETFNNVTADGVAEGVPSVVSDTIDWAPQNWIASSDDPKDVANKARHLLVDPHAAREGYHALQSYVSKGIHYWREFLERP